MLTSKLGVADAAIAEEFPNLTFSTAAVTAQVTGSLAVVVVSGHYPLT